MARKSIQAGGFRPLPKLSSPIFVQKPTQNVAVVRFNSHSNLPLRPKKKRAASLITYAGSKRASDEPLVNRPAKLQRIKELDSSIFEKKLDAPILPKAIESFLLSPSPKSPATAVTLVDQEEYRRRSKIGCYAAKIKRNRALALNIRSSWKDMPTLGQKGIKNPGVLCYRNSLLQALLHTPKIWAWLRDYHHPDLCVWEHSSCIACQLRRVFEKYWNGSADELLKATKRLDQVFIANLWQGGRTGRQEDPEEQLVWLAKMFSEQLPSSQYQAFEAITRFIINSSTKCASCGHASTRKDEMEGTISIDLHPRIKKNNNLIEYLKPYFSYSVEGYKCYSCTSTSPKQRRREIVHAPDTLVIQLKRFTPDGRKDSIPIAFSSSLSLDHLRSTSNLTCCAYELLAIVCHSGGVHGGHYVCRAQGPDGLWKKYDDLNVSRITAAQALDPGPRGGWTPYLLFYQRKSLPVADGNYQK